MLIRQSFTAAVIINVNVLRCLKLPPGNIVKIPFGIVKCKSHRVNGKKVLSGQPDRQ